MKYNSLAFFYGFENLASLATVESFPLCRVCQKMGRGCGQKEVTSHSAETREAKKSREEDQEG